MFINHVNEYKLKIAAMVELVDTLVLETKDN
jgi:hypothetical protein